MRFAVESARENSEHFVEWIGYEEARARLEPQAFLQRGINGGGRKTREYPLGLWRTAQLTEWPLTGGYDPSRVSQHLIECRVARTGGGLETAIDEGALWTVLHMNRCATEFGHSVIFDQRPRPSWEERVFRC